MTNPASTIDYRPFLARLDPLWNPLVHRGGRYVTDNPASTRRDWGEAALLGNGMIGAAIYKKSAEALNWELGRNDAEAHNHLRGLDWSVPRIPLGDLRLEPAGEIIRESMRLSLYDAEASGEIHTAKGRILWTSFADAVRDVLVVTLHGEGEESAARLHLVPAHGVSPRIAWTKAANASPLPPPPVVTNANGTELAVQELIDQDGAVSGECALAMRCLKLEATTRLYLVGIDHSRENGRARQRVLETVAQAAADGLEELLSEHRDWWHAYYPASFVSIPDTRWEAFYWIQMYKLASATRGTMREAIDNQGPWLTETSWPGTWWNLNVQLSYSPLYTANRTELAESLVRTIDGNRERMQANAALICADGMYMGRASGRLCEGNRMPAGESIQAGSLPLFELGNFTWIVHLLHRHYRCTMDRAFLKEKVYPVLRANLNVYLKLLRRWEDGKLHLPKTTSPEYPNPKQGLSNSCPAHDTSYDLALLRWGLQTLLETNDELNLGDELADTWRDTLRDLAPICVDENGIMVARDLPFELSHRHYSHLFALYPLHLLDLENPQERSLAQTSFLHWIHTTGALQGYSYTGGTCMAAALGDGNLALECLDRLRDYLLPNTMYLERGGPVIETPLSGAESIHYLLLQSHGGIVRVFPAIPDRFADVAFANLLAEGAFEISGKRAGGQNLWVRITSKAGQPLRIQPNLQGTLKAHGERKFQLVEEGNGIYRIDLAQGETILLYDGDSVPELDLAPVASQPAYENYYGSLKPDMGSRALGAGENAL